MNSLFRNRNHLAMNKIVRYSHSLLLFRIQTENVRIAIGQVGSRSRPPPRTVRTFKARAGGGARTWGEKPCKRLPISIFTRRSG